GTILGAAGLDDVLGRGSLAARPGLITAANAGCVLSRGAILLVSLKALGFLAAAILLGHWLTPRLLKLAARMKVTGILLTTGLVFCFVLAYLGTLAGLSLNVGAFAGGLILETRQFRVFEESRDQSIESLLSPLSTF